jgi:hypothetical protein
MPLFYYIDGTESDADEDVVTGIEGTRTPALNYVEVFYDDATEPHNIVAALKRVRDYASVKDIDKTVWEFP